MPALSENRAQRADKSNFAGINLLQDLILSIADLGSPFLVEVITQINFFKEKDESM